MLRRLTAAAVVLLAATPVLAANKDIERLNIQMAALQGQITDLVRTSDDNMREIRRLNEALAEQNSLIKKALADRRIQDESLHVSLRELSEKIGELSDRMQALASAPSTVPATAGPGLPPSPVGGTASGPPPTYASGPPAAVASPPSGTAPSGGVVPAGPAPRELYSQAYADYARGNYDLAIQEYQEFLRAFRETDLADNAQYWIGECLYAKQKYSDAVEAWNALLRDFPGSDKLPDARFKKGLALERLGRKSQALMEYRYVAERYPNSEAGKKAREKLSPQ